VSATDSSDVGTHPKTFSLKEIKDEERNREKKEKQRIGEFFYL
jgi:hypothetical protein